MLGLLHRDGNLVRTIAAFDVLAVDNLGPRPALGGTQDDHGPEGTLRAALLSCLALDLLDFLDALIKRFRHLSVHRHGLVALHEDGLIAAAVEEALHFVLGNTCKDGRVIDLESVEVQNRKHCAVRYGVEELIGMPCGRKRSRLSLAVTDDDCRNQIGVIKHGAVGMRNGISELAAFVDGTGRLRRYVRGDTAGERELLAQSRHTLFVLGDVGIDFAVGALKIGVCDEEVAAVSGTGKQNHIKIELLDNTVEVDIHKVLSGDRSPVTDDFLLDLITRQRFTEKRILQHIELCRREVVCRAPVCIHLLQILFRQRLLFGNGFVAHGFLLVI